MTSLSPGTILLTGASRGIGERIAHDLVDRGLVRGTLLLTARKQDDLDRVADALRAKGATVQTLAADMMLPQDHDRVVQAATSYGPVAAAIFNAGVENTLAAWDQSADMIGRQVTVNLTAPLQMTRALLPTLRAQGHGALVYVSSMSGKSPTPYNSIYTATKHGLVGFTKTLSIELGDSGPTAGVVCPSFVADAGMWHSFGLKAPAMLREVPMQRVLDGVVSALQGQVEVLVAPGPIRLLLALSALFPSLEASVLRWMGVTDVLRQRAEVQATRMGSAASGG